MTVCTAMVCTDPTASSPQKQRRRGTLTWTLRDADEAVLILGIWVGLHLKPLLVVNQSLGTLRHTGAGVVEAATRLQRGHGRRQCGHAGFFSFSKQNYFIV